MVSFGDLPKGLRRSSRFRSAKVAGLQDLCKRMKEVPFKNYTSVPLYVLTLPPTARASGETWRDRGLSKNYFGYIKKLCTLPQIVSQLAVEKSVFSLLND